MNKKNGGMPDNEILKNIQTLKKHYPEYFHKRVNFNAVLHNRNSVSKIHEFFSKKFNKIIRIGEIKNIGIKTDKQRSFMEIYSSVDKSLNSPGTDKDTITREMFINLPNIQALSTFLHKYSGFFFENFRGIVDGERKDKPFPTGTCIPFSKKIFVTASGRLIACESIIRHFYLGKITTKQVLLNFEKIAQLYNLYYNRIIPLCNSCYNQKACSSCIFNLLSLSNRENLTCPSFMDYSRFSNYLTANIDYFEAYPKMFTLIMTEVKID